MAEFFSPTPYPGVNGVLLGFAARIQSILGRQFLGLYLYGSLALGDFDPRTSDIDFIVVTSRELPEETFTALGEMHAQFDGSGSLWSKKVEAAYIPREALNTAAPTPHRYPQIEKGTALIRAPLEIGWAFQRYTLREHGVVVAGPELRPILDPVDPADMRRAALAIMASWLEEARCDPSWIAWARVRSNQAFLVLTLCRLLYTLETGEVTSKRAAAHWAQINLGRRWDDLIVRSLAGQHDDRETPEDDFDGMLTLLNYVVERSQPST